MSELQLSATEIALISAATGFVAAILAQIVSGLLSLVREYYIDQIKVRRLEAAAAIDLIVSLEEVIETCHNIVALDRLIVDPDDSLKYTFECELPSADMIENITYRDLESTMALDVAKLKSDLQRAIIYLASIEMIPPDYGCAIDERKRIFANIGARAVRISNKIRKANSMDTIVGSGRYDPNVDFINAIESTIAEQDHPSSDQQQK